MRLSVVGVAAVLVSSLILAPTPFLFHYNPNKNPTPGDSCIKARLERIRITTPCCHLERFLTTFALVATLRYPVGLGEAAFRYCYSHLCSQPGPRESSSREKNECHVCSLLFSRPKSSHKRELNAKKRAERQQRPEERSRAVSLGVVGQLWLTGGSGRPRVNNG